ncbi:uncharacterized protein EI90DRAFT_3123934 [Cantharellus anzutake]|uniref:uncharacterized protein n=1 Tax=Cantharellus anzutake TaxID=1750568 RepID=UPI001905A1A4|nr:uncharacterized protein EI90DRAFT_3123934 [Cantharellus anzutake]KAF8330722.1 hypothetical protein EI90DRAFT_3123934 [Cantharellus anzutake]
MIIAIHSSSERSSKEESRIIFPISEQSSSTTKPLFAFTPSSSPFYELSSPFLAILVTDIDQRTISRFQLDPPNYPAPLNLPMAATVVAEDNEENASPQPW